MCSCTHSQTRLFDVRSFVTLNLDFGIINKQVSSKKITILVISLQVPNHEVFKRKCVLFKFLIEVSQRQIFVSLRYHLDGLQCLASIELLKPTAVGTPQ